MTWVADNRHWLEPYVRDMADRMGLRDWKITILDEPSDDDAAGGQCDLVYGRKVADLKIRVPSAPEELRHVVVHELLHCHAALLDWNANSIEKALSPQAFDLWHYGFEDAQEIMIDGIATAWAETLPLPVHEIVISSKRAEVHA